MSGRDPQGGSFLQYSSRDSLDLFNLAGREVLVRRPRSNHGKSYNPYGKQAKEARAAAKAGQSEDEA